MSFRMLQSAIKCTCPHTHTQTVSVISWPSLVIDSLGFQCVSPSHSFLSGSISVLPLHSGFLNKPEMYRLIQLGEDFQRQEYNQHDISPFLMSPPQWQQSQPRWQRVGFIPRGQTQLAFHNRVCAAERLVQQHETSWSSIVIGIFDVHTIRRFFVVKGCFYS